MESIPYDKRSGKIWFNGTPIDWSEVKIHVLSHGLHYASCVFEGERVYDGEIFKLEEHTERLFHSASRMGFKIPYTQDLLNKAKLKANKKHIFKNNGMKKNKVNFLKINIYPDGGISRIRAFGKFTK